jgi:hypothetical protein
MTDVELQKTIEESLRNTSNKSTDVNIPSTGVKIPSTYAHYVKTNEKPLKPSKNPPRAGMKLVQTVKNGGWLTK